MSLDLHLLAIWLVAYLAAGLFYVLRGLDAGQIPAAWGELSILCFVALFWLPITLGNLVKLHRTRALAFVFVHFCTETAPPLALLLSIVLATESLAAS